MNNPAPIARARENSTIRNCAKIRFVLRRHPKLTRRQIAEKTHLENGEVSARVREMVLRGELSECGYALSPITGLAVGVVRLAK